MTQSPPDRPLLFVHDWYTNPEEDWATQATYFERHYHCLYYRLAGHPGGPELPFGQPAVDLNLTELGRFLAGHELPMPIVAHGVGALLALRYAALNPQHVSALILICPIYRLERFRRLAAFATALPFLNWLFPMLADPAGRGEPWIPRLREARANLRGQAALAYLRALRHAGAPQPTDAPVPIFLIAGDEDPWRTSASGEYLSENLRGSRLLRYGHLGHSPHGEEPELVNAAMEQFLAAHRSAGPLHTVARWLKSIKKLIVGDGTSD